MSRETNTLNFCRRVVNDAPKHRLHFRLTGIWVVRIILLVFEFSMLNSTDFSAKNNVLSRIFDVTNVVGHLVYATDFASSVHLVATIGFDESK